MIGRVVFYILLTFIFINFINALLHEHNFYKNRHQIGYVEDFTVCSIADLDFDESGRI